MAFWSDLEVRFHRLITLGSREPLFLTAVEGSRENYQHRVVPVWGGHRNFLFILMDSDEGIYGIGEAGITGRELAVVGAVEQLSRYSSVRAQLVLSPFIAVLQCS